MPTYIAALATESDDGFCDLTILARVIDGYIIGDDGAEVPQYSIGDPVPGTVPVTLTVRTDDHCDDALASPAPGPGKAALPCYDRRGSAGREEPRPGDEPEGAL